MKLTTTGGVLTILDANDAVSAVLQNITKVQRDSVGSVIRVYGGFGSHEIKKADVTHLNGSSFSGTTQDLVTSISGLVGQSQIGKVGVFSDLISVTLSLDTSAYASGDLLADTQAISNAVRVLGGQAVLQSIMVIDEDDVGAAFSIYILGANNTMGTENSAPSISDANARAIQAIVDIATTDYKDLGGVKVANIRGIGAVVEAASDSKDLYVSVVNGTGTPTYTASGIKLVLGFLQDG